ncbi:MAG: gliding motility lipoprotein GldH [Bacteroidota bacterium]|nr:gliding motility lipoprotein GldH [Bacteroidota bacterium]
MRKTVFLFLLSVILVSCEKNIFFQENKKIEGEKWLMNQPCEFTVGVSDIHRNYDFYLNIRNTADYKYSNLYLFLHTYYPGGTTSVDTLECTLAQPDGKWIGTGFGRIKYQQIPIKQNVRFPRAGTYRFQIFQAMRGDVEGISDIGLRIENAKPN